jgi:Bacterial pre-peptidase C-terminal domain
MNYFSKAQTKSITANLGQVFGSGSRRNSVSRKNKSDLFEFSLKNRTMFSSSLTSLRNNADLRILDSNFKSVAVSNNRGKKAEQISTLLQPGTYYLQVNSSKRSSTPFSLDYTAINTLPGRTEQEYSNMALSAQSAAFDYYFSGIASGRTRCQAINDTFIRYAGQGDSIALEYYKLASKAEIDAYALSILL